MTTRPSLRQMRYFVALAEAGQYRRAAESLGLSQPSLSLQIGNLEKILRLTLLERGRRGIVLTAQGRDVLVRARRIVDEVDALTGLAETLRHGLTGTLRLGSTPTIGPYFLPRVVRRLHADFPDLRLIVRDGAPRDLLEDLQAGVHDLILTQLPVQARSLTVARLFREPLRVALAQDHPLAGREMLMDADLAGQDILSLSPAFALHSQIAALADEVGAQLRQDYEGTSLDALRQMAAMRMGVAFLPALYIKSEASSSGDVVVRRFRRDAFYRSVGLVWRSNAGQGGAYQRFTDIARAVAREEFKGLVTPES